MPSWFRAIALLTVPLAVAPAYALMAHRVPARNVATHAIRSVTLNRRTLNVAAREVMTVAVDFAQRGTASVLIVGSAGCPELVTS